MHSLSTFVMIRTTVAFKGWKMQSKELGKRSVCAQTAQRTLEGDAGGTDKSTCAARVLDTVLSLSWAADMQAEKRLKTGLGY